MRIPLAHLLGLFALLGLLLTPLTTLAAFKAAPAIVATPAQTAPGGTVTVAGTGFVPGARLALVGLTARGTMRLTLVEMVAGADGGFAATFRVAGFYPAAPLPLIVASMPDGTELARTVVLVTDAPSIASEKLAVSPGTGTGGTRFTATGEGFKAGTTVAFFTTETAKGPAGGILEVARVRVPADGRVAFGFDSTGYSVEEHDLVAFTDGIVLGFPLVRPTFVVTAAAMPGLPSTGGGRMAHRNSGAWTLLAALALVCLVHAARPGRRPASRR